MYFFGLFIKSMNLYKQMKWNKLKLKLCTGSEIFINIQENINKWYCNLGLSFFVSINNIKLLLFNDNSVYNNVVVYYNTQNALHQFRCINLLFYIRILIYFYTEIYNVIIIGSSSLRHIYTTNKRYVQSWRFM